MKILFAFLFLFIYSPQDNSEKMPWDKDRKLTWEDFKGKAQPNASFVASTNSGISFSYSYSQQNGAVDVTYTVQSNFYPEKSWFQPGRVTQHILNHEQLHFDISELHARILRKRLSEKTFTTRVKSEVEKLYNDTERERRAMQSKFDAETDHSRNIEKEIFWEKYVAQKLEEYEQWQ
ncbi:DUF922 domain-containing protein [Aequorivita echinoideorum]|uniref:DUF922 domain-containing protein n=1 Tax=Aequorivita echinoideorum TaxID=1549647 RepID=A0ABS5S507_9FLAO|nr:DUF922 domain-containing protein [Aequorivita echinoideorum]MBT0608296.1 DUF922 domain-containing protein [Aequorivita echinoideorum]